jgi:AraC family transcriptional regulator
VPETSTLPATKYGHVLGDPDWAGFPMRVGTYPGSGRVEGLSTQSDCILVWSGGRSEVTLLCRAAGRTTERHHFVRQSGNLDLLPRGTTLEEIVWSGEETSCVSVLLPDELPRLLGDGEWGLSVEAGPRFNLSDAHIVDLVRRLFAQATLGEPLGPSYAKALCLALATYVSRKFGNREPRVMAGFGLPEIDAEKVVAFIENNLASNLGLAELAALVGFSPDHFARLFKRSFGVPPHQYLTVRRIERAKGMLRDPSRSLSEVGLSCGFSTQARFNSVFKQHTGVTPGAYRKG